MIMGNILGNIGIMEKKTETTIRLGLCGGNIGIMGKKMEATTLGL